MNADQWRDDAAKVLRDARGSGISWSEALTMTRRPLTHQEIADALFPLVADVYAENEKLRGALEDMWRKHYHPGPDCGVCRMWAALAPADKEDGNG